MFRHFYSLSFISLLFCFSKSILEVLLWRARKMNMMSRMMIKTKWGKGGRRYKKETRISVNRIDNTFVSFSFSLKKIFFLLLSKTIKVNLRFPMSFPSCSNWGWNTFQQKFVDKFRLFSSFDQSKLKKRKHFKWNFR